MDALIPRLADLGLLPDAPVRHPGDRIHGGDLPHVRYLKLSEGCDHGCAFCAIPLMRGRHRSFALADVIREAQVLEGQGAREVNLVAQDLAHYGRDRRDGVGLAEALEALVRETGIPWFRMLYLYSAGITPRLLEVVAREPRIVPYLDMPIQHAADAVLARMRRPERQRTIREKVARFREAVPQVAIRTTCIVGFPGETDADVEELLRFLDEIAFDRVGAFTYSAQEGTAAAALPDDVPEPVKRERLERLLELQRGVTADRYEAMLGRAARVLVDRADAAGAEGRGGWQAEGIDGVVRVSTPAPPGTFLTVRLETIEDDLDFRGTVVSVDAPPAPALSRRSLRVLPTSIGSYGR
jgi:ribosomal protein S12 methylthiotransferase